MLAIRLLFVDQGEPDNAQDEQAAAVHHSIVHQAEIAYDALGTVPHSGQAPGGFFTGYVLDNSQNNPATNSGWFESNHIPLYGGTFDANGWRSLAPITHSISTDVYYMLEGDDSGVPLFDFTSEPDFEITLSVYDREFTDNLRNLQCGYIDESTEMRLSDWQERTAPVRLRDNIARLLSPLL